MGKVGIAALCGQRWTCAFFFSMARHCGRYAGVEPNDDLEADEAAALSAHCMDL